MIPVRILGTATALPGRPIPTEELAQRVGRDPALMVKKTGIETRHWVEPGTSQAAFGASALKQALEAAGLSATALRRIVFVSSGGGDQLIPANANRVAAALGLSGSCDAFDLNNACMGFLTAFDLAARSVATGLGPVAIVVAELGSRIIRPEEPRPYLVFGDVAVAVVLGEGGEDEGVLAARFGNNGTLPPDVHLEHPLATGKPEHVRFDLSSAGIARIALDTVRASTRQALEQAGVALHEIEWILPHQPNGAMFRLLSSTLEIDPARTVPVVQEIGSVGAASIPVSLDRLLRTRPVKPGDRILMTGVGAGVAFGAILYRVGS